VAELKTKQTNASVTAYLNAITDRQKRSDCRAVAKMMRDATGKSCLTIKKLEDVDSAVLRKLIEASVGEMRRKYK